MEEFTHYTINEDDGSKLLCRITDTLRTFPTAYRIYAEDGCFYNVFATSLHMIPVEQDNTND